MEYLQNPSWLISRQDMKAIDKHVAALILFRQNSETGPGFCFEKQENMAERLGISKWSLNLSLARLSCKDGGRMNGMGKRRKNNYYRKPLIEKTRRWYKGSKKTIYWIDTAKDSTAWWMMEDFHGRMGLGDNRTHPKEWNFNTHKEQPIKEENIISFPSLRGHKSEIS